MMTIDKALTFFLLLFLPLFLTSCTFSVPISSTTESLAALNSTKESTVSAGASSSERQIESIQESSVSLYGSTSSTALNSTIQSTASVANSSSVEMIQDESSSKNEFSQWVSLDTPEFSPVCSFFEEKTDLQVSYLYVTDSQGEPVSNVMCYFPYEVSYSMPSGLIPMVWVRKPESNPMKLALANPNTDGKTMFQWYENVELDMTGKQAYHLIWDMESPDEYAQTSEESITVSLKFEDETPASGLFAYLGLIIPEALREADEETNPSFGYVPSPEEIPNGIIGAEGYKDSMDRGRYADAEGNLCFALDISGCDKKRTYLQLRIYENAEGQTVSTDFHPRLEIPLYDEDGVLRRSIEVTVPKPQ
jgi:hypothetical protein